MESVAEQLSLLEDLNTRQDTVLAQLDALNKQVEALLLEVTESKSAEPSAGGGLISQVDLAPAAAQS